MNPEELKRRVARIRQELEEAADGKYPAPRLIAVTKTHSAEEILPLADAGADGEASRPGGPVSDSPDRPAAAEQCKADHRGRVHDPVGGFGAAGTGDP